MRIVTVAIIAATLVSCSRDGRGRPPNVILITMDTMRADHLGCYGYLRPTSPNIDEFATVATMYLRAMASAPWTIPSHASMFTGMDPFQHGAHTRIPNGRGYNIRPLDDEHLTLAEVFNAEGYRTGAFVANDGLLSTRWQLDQGFDTYHVKRERADAVNRRVLDWLDAGGQSDSPFFLFINYMDTHRPYNTEPRSGFLDRPVVQDDGDLVLMLYHHVMTKTGPIPQDLVRLVIDQYDTAVANLDDQVGALLDAVKSRDLYESTMIVLTSDHGEYFGEHRLVEHSKDVYQEALWVPLIVKTPGQAVGGRSDETVSSSDIPMLILSHLSGDLAMRYADSFPNAIGNHPTISENYYSRTPDLLIPELGKRFDRVRTVVYEWPYKYIHSSDGDLELYDLERDRRETSNRVDENVVAEAMRNRLEAFLSTRERYARDVDPPTLTPEEIEKLRALGYVGD